MIRRAIHTRAVRATGAAKIRATGAATAARAVPILCALALGAAARPVHASSVYSAGGLGEPALEEQARIRALGGAGAAEHGPRDFSLVNPASLAEVEHLLLEATMLPALRRISAVLPAPAASVPGETVRETTFPSVRAAIALPGRITLAASYLAGTDADFHIERTESAGAASSLEIEGTGGINYLRVSLARRITPSFRIGLDYDVIAGSYGETWTRTFSDSGLSTAHDSLEVTYPKRGRWRFGAQLIRGDWSIGAVYETSKALPLETTKHTIGATDRLSGTTLTLPSGIVVGISAPVRDRLRAVAQYRRANWDRSSLQSDLVDFRALERFSLGFERRRGTEDGMSFWRRLPIRVGGYLLRWPDLLPVAGASDISGGTAPVNEWALTFGSGFLSQDKGGGIDFSLEAGSRGKRSDLGADERFIRLGVSLLLSDETWKGTFRR